MQCKNIVVVGTDTEIGKTVVSLILMKQLIGKNEKPIYIKPFQTGCKDIFDRDSDAKFIYENLGKDEVDFSKSVLNCNKNPKAPYFAARDEKSTIDIDDTLNSIRDLTQSFTHSIIEMSGGLFVPVTEKMLVVDFIQEIDCEVILVGRAGLGTINHTLLTIEALSKRGMTPTEIVLVDKNGDTNSKMTDENIEAIEMFSGIKAKKIGRIEDFDRIDSSVSLGNL